MQTAEKDAVLKADIPMDLVKTCNDAFLSCFSDQEAKFSDLHKGILDELREEMVSRYGDAQGFSVQASVVTAIYGIMPV